MRRLSLLLWLILAANLAAQAQQSELLSLPWSSWQFHFGNDPRCATLDGAGCILNPGSYPAEEYPVEPQEWQRISVTLPPSLQVPQQLGLLIEDEDCPYQVFVNGQLIGARGDLDSNSCPFNSRAVFPFSSTRPERTSADRHPCLHTRRQ